jgi:hypothetical protein
VSQRTSSEKFQKTLEYSRLALQEACGSRKSLRGYRNSVTLAQLGALEGLLAYLPSTLADANRYEIFEEWLHMARWLMLRSLQQARLYVRMRDTVPKAIDFRDEPLFLEAPMLEMPLRDERQRLQAYQFQSKTWLKLREVQIQAAITALGFTELVMDARSRFYPYPIKWQALRPIGKPIKTFEPMDAWVFRVCFEATQDDDGQPILRGFEQNLNPDDLVDSLLKTHFDTKFDLVTGKRTRVLSRPRLAVHKDRLGRR